MKTLTVTMLLQKCKVATMATFNQPLLIDAGVVVVISAAKIGLLLLKPFFLAKIVRKNLSNIAVTTVTTVTFIFLKLIKHRTVLRYSLVTAFFKPP